MSLTTRSCPRKNGQSGNYCAYCHYWEGDSQLQSVGAGIIKFDTSAKGYCVFNGRHHIKYGNNSACRDFHLSNAADKYAK